MEDLKRLLIDHPFLQGLSEAHVQFLTGCAANVRFKKGAFLFREGGECGNTFLVRDGQVGLQISDPAKGTVEFARVGPGEILGWSWLFSPYQWHFDAQALEDTLAFSLDGKCLDKKLQSDHDLGFELLKRFLYQSHRRLEKTRVQLLDVYQKAN